MRQLKSQAIVKADVPNKNNRVYPRAILERIVVEFKKGEMIGQLGMPGDSMIHFSQASHTIDSLSLIDGELLADITLIETPHGKVLDQLLLAGVKVGFRIQGVGSVKTIDGVDVVQEDFKLVTINATDHPA